MSNTATEFDLTSQIHTTVSDVFDTMLGMTATPDASVAIDTERGRVTASIGIAGETVGGAVYIDFEEEFAVVVTGAMLGMAPEEIEDHAEVNDVVGELCNMVAGNLKSAICDFGRICAVSTPSIIRGTAFSVEALPKDSMRIFHFSADGRPFTVSVELKFK